MRVKVLDASAAAAVLFGEPEGAAVAADVADAALAAPTLLRYELANVAAKKRQQQPAMADRLDRALDLFDELTIDEVDVPLGALVGVAAELHVTAYDAAYAWLARELHADLVTLDRKLAAAVKHADAINDKRAARRQPV